MRIDGESTEIRAAVLLAAALAGWPGCQGEPAGDEPGNQPVPAAGEPAENPGAPAVTSAAGQPVAKSWSASGVEPLPDTLELIGDHLFSVDTTQEEFDLTVHGDDGLRLVGRLSSPEGKREIVLHGLGERREPAVVFPSDWLLPAVAAVNGEGQVAVCVNRLVGKPSPLTRGALPDPNLGVDLVCRTFADHHWSAEVVLTRGKGADWLYDVTARRNGGFWVTCSRDSTGRMMDDTQPGDGMYRVELRDGKFGVPVLARAFPQAGK